LGFVITRETKIAKYDFGLNLLIWRGYNHYDSSKQWLFGWPGQVLLGGNLQIPLVYSIGYFTAASAIYILYLSFKIRPNKGRYTNHMVQGRRWNPCKTTSNYDGGVRSDKKPRGLFFFSLWSRGKTRHMGDWVFKCASFSDPRRPFSSFGITISFSVRHYWLIKIVPYFFHKT